MWYYDTKDERCRQFYYGGCGGNGNKFQTEPECLQRCERKSEPTPKPVPPPQETIPTDICAAPADAGGCRNFTLLWYYDGANSNCRQFYYGGCDGNDNRFATNDECISRCQREDKPPIQEPPIEERPIVHTNEQQPSVPKDLCESNVDVGTCDTYVIMWYYNTTHSQCMQFYYGGCGGNENRFPTEAACAQRCPAEKAQPPVSPPDNNTRQPSDEEKCFLRPDIGNCNSNVTRWYYDSSQGLCDEFEYGGCGGNGNNFENEEECADSCHPVQDTCILPPVRGRCNDNLRSWYYDANSKSCNEFEFSGCRGNRNNFPTQAECLQFCASESGPPEPEPPVQPVSF